MVLKQMPNLNKFKFKKFHKYSSFFLKSKEHKLFFLREGEYGLQSLDAGKLTFKQIESCRRTMRRGFGKFSRIKINLSLSSPMSKKPIGTRMGKGKGAISHWIAPVKKGKVLFEINSNLISPLKVYSIFKKVQSKLSIKTKIVKVFY